VVDLNHAFHQFEMDEESKNLFVFYGPESRLFRFNRLVMGTSSASSECHERIRRVVEGLGVQQIKDDVVVHGKGMGHNKETRGTIPMTPKIQHHTKKSKM